MSNTVVAVRGLRSQFGHHVVHRALDLDVYRGEILGVVGASGTGKSVLLRTIVGLREPQAGTIEVFGEQWHQLDDANRDRLSQRWGVMFQDGALFSSLSVGENVASPLREFTDLGPRLRNELVALKLQLVGLEPEVAQKMPADLSGGMRKRVALARSLALDPELLFLDEPTAGLDPIGAAAFDQLLVDLARTLGLTVFLVTHDLDSLYATTDRVAALAEQKVLAVDTIDQLEKLEHPWLKEYFHGPRSRSAGQ